MLTSSPADGVQFQLAQLVNFEQSVSRFSLLAVEVAIAVIIGSVGHGPPSLAFGINWRKFFSVSNEDVANSNRHRRYRPSEIYEGDVDRARYIVYPARDSYYAVPYDHGPTNQNLLSNGIGKMLILFSRFTSVNPELAGFV